MKRRDIALQQEHCIGKKFYLKINVESDNTIICLITYPYCMVSMVEEVPVDNPRG